MAAALSEKDLKEKAKQIRTSIIEMVHSAACGHPGGPLGLADIFAYLFFEELNHKPKQPLWPGRDRLLISNGHVSAIRYAAMAHSGYFPVKELTEFRKLGSRLQGHPSTRYMPEVENSSGSLGQGLSQAVGYALGAKLQKQKYRVFCCMSDGECGEGMTWEAAQNAVHHNAPVIAFMDLNGIQIDGFTKDVMDLGDLSAKFKSFGWQVQTADGHKFSEIRKAFQKAGKGSGPQMILFNTVLGKGVSYMENNPDWHGKAPNDELAKQALEELAAS